MKMRIQVFIFLSAALLAASNEDEDIGHVKWYNIYKVLHDIMDTGLAADQLQDRLYKEYKWTKEIVSGEDILNEKEKHLSTIFRTNVEALEDLKAAIESAYDTWTVLNKTQIPEIPREDLCCKSDSVNPDGCVKLSPSEFLNDPLYSSKPPPQVLQVMKKNQENLVHVHMQYFAFEDGGVFFYPAYPKEQYLNCDDYDPRRRYFFVESKSPSNKDYVFIVNPGSTTKTILLDVLSRALEDVTPNDRMGICLSGQQSCGADMMLKYPSSRWPQGDTPLGGHTALNALITGSERNKGKFKTYMEQWIEKLKMMKTEESSSVENHAKAIEAGLELMENGTHQENVIYENLYSRDERQRKLVYISQNLNSVISWNDHPQLTDIINTTLSKGIEILTCNINGDITHQEHFCERLNTTNNDSDSAEIKGNTESEQPLVLLPYWDASGLGLITSVCLALKKEGIFKGTVCTDLSIIDDLEDALTIKNIEGAYVFLADTSGHALFHPLLTAPHSLSQHPTYVQISKLEPDKNILPILKSMARMEQGSKVVTVLQPQPIGRIMQTSLPETVRLKRQKFKYLWSPINSTDFSIAVVLPINSESGQIISSSYNCLNECDTSDFHYHRLDLDIPEKHETCKFFCTRSYKGHGTIKFSPRSYKKVMEYVRNENETEVNKLYGIFHDNKQYKEVFKNDMQHSIDFVEAAENSWKKGRNLSDYVGLRYLGTSNGISMMFPGAILKPEYDPRPRPWYQMAMSNLETNKSVSVTTPYCDSWGAGLIYTIAMALRGNEYEAVAVISADIKTEYLSTVFLEHIPKCNNEFRCILAEQSGYVVFDSIWNENDEPMICNPRSNLEAMHLTAKHHALAHEMIADKLLRRKGCHDYERDVTFYYWSLSIPKGRKRFDSPYYHVFKIPFTNLYLIIMKSQTPKSAEKCRCDQFEIRPDSNLQECYSTCRLSCECPCKAGPTTEPCNANDADVHRSNRILAACQPEGIKLALTQQYTKALLKNETSCFNYTCKEKSKEQCKRIVWCIWTGNEKCEKIDTNQCLLETVAT